MQLLNNGAELVESAIGLRTISVLQAEAEQWYTRVAELAQEVGAWQVGKHLPAELRYVPTATSLALNGVLPIEQVIDALSLHLIETIQSILGDELVVSVDIAWLRRQFPPMMRPDEAMPHAWHQDGAFGADFLSAEPQPLLPMVTAWMPLNPCGKDAPGIEIRHESPDRLLSIAELQAAGEDSAETWTPEMQPGQALLMTGRCLHRTFSAEPMTQIRTSAELRFFRAKPIPERVQHHNMIAVPTTK